MIWTRVTRLEQLLDERPGIDVVDSHTCGQPTRVILGGTGLKDGMTPEEGRDYLMNSADWARRIAVMEPRGQRSMFGAAIIHPSGPDESFGVVYMDASTYPDMCGHATIGVATTLFELGLIGPARPPDDTTEFPFQLRTPVGTLKLILTVKRGKCHAVTFQMPLAYYVGSMDVHVAPGRTARADIGWAGQYYAYVPVEETGLKIELDEIDELLASATPIRRQIAHDFRAIDPRTSFVPEVGNIVWTGAPQNTAAHARNIPHSSSGSFDRSPCGTATCARMAVLVAQGDLQAGEDFVNESILGTLYYGRVVREHLDGDFQGIVPQVRGSAWITGASRLTRDPDDPLGLGYLIGGGRAVI
ncbi:Proline racemase [Cyphellophora attinorum]|uniref:trans-L-3-hydroxyproline dehydratase n=1 Tax=Cyphellophora attinorum TaxID=1664694 RepID=A0A0N0NIY5_9EURO|nr:Proline racemase [Phialophora attinorum]KPI36288.1 Proline racemase [Phialophora attinorum]